MTAAKHTPGPWSYDFGNNGAAIYKQDVGTIANVPDDLVDHESNARLLAAAPELLEALQECVSQISAMQAIGKQTNADGATSLEKARDAIAKATGAA